VFLQVRTSVSLVSFVSFAISQPDVFGDRVVLVNRLLEQDGNQATKLLNRERSDVDAVDFDAVALGSYGSQSVCVA
jgi:hypothetical protein